MRARGDHCDVVLGHRPFAGGLGASLYVGTDGPDSIRYRRMKAVDDAPFYPLSTDVIDLSADTIPKTMAVAHVTSPANQIDYALPAEMLGGDVWCQVRTFRDDIENESVYLPRQVSVGDDGTDASSIQGSATITEVVKLDAGGYRVSWSWSKSRDGIQPTQFVIKKVSGSGAIAAVAVTVVQSLRLYSATITGLSDGVDYVFKLDGETQTVTTTLIASIPLTGDASGPPAVSNLSINPA